jgi:hypothetical protein
MDMRVVGEGWGAKAPTHKAQLGVGASRKPQAASRKPQAASRLVYTGGVHHTLPLAVFRSFQKKRHLY